MQHGLERTCFDFTYGWTSRVQQFVKWYGSIMNCLLCCCPNKHRLVRQLNSLVATSLEKCWLAIGNRWQFLMAPTRTLRKIRAGPCTAKISGSKRRPPFAHLSYLDRTFESNSFSRRPSLWIGNLRLSLEEQCVLLRKCRTTYLHSASIWGPLHTFWLCSELGFQAHWVFQPSQTMVPLGGRTNPSTWQQDRHLPRILL